MAYLPPVIPSEARNRGLVHPPSLRANSPPPNTAKPSPASSPANRPPSTSPPKSASSTASSRSPPKASSNPPTTFPTAASPSPSPNPPSPLWPTHAMGLHRPRLFLLPHSPLATRHSPLFLPSA